MKLTKKQETKLTTLAFAEKSNKEIAKELGIELKDVFAARSRLGITINKVKVAKIATENGQPVADPMVKRKKDEIISEIIKVEKAHETAKKKVDRCLDRLEILYGELADAHDINS